MATEENVERAAEREHRPSPIDVHVGSRVRLRRTLLGMSQEKLGEALGLTFQQVQKYERGVNRIGASRLYDLSRVLDVPISFFFDDMPMGGGSVSFAQRNHGVAEPGQDPFGASGHAAAAGIPPDLLQQRETLELVRAYNRIQDPSIRKRVFDLIKAMTPPE
ncbi:helix-turn-helix domain-containing protein [Sabulicella glaciei]|uniref:Helix-turn-helix domain-containing protein n=1 Tax=Sabulicella glaciei TaxID=2984948 RepID=A0ABT3NX67_9PROT|nr:helix-turn-helix transcriptional regulator [Roseococcus sp. MDT2-1-1]MCW8086716.1 helix-turn-helix domain-containing protein [Roseococcus sp. MDT2-1-1]